MSKSYDVARIALYWIQVSLWYDVLNVTYLTRN